MIDHAPLPDAYYGNDHEQDSPLTHDEREAFRDELRYLIAGIKEEAEIVEAFVPVAAEKAGGFAGFREKATKTKSLINRLEDITLPDPDEVADDLDRYWDRLSEPKNLIARFRRLRT